MTPGDDRLSGKARFISRVIKLRSFDHEYS